MTLLQLLTTFGAVLGIVLVGVLAVVPPALDLGLARTHPDH